MACARAGRHQFMSDFLHLLFSTSLPGPCFMWREQYAFTCSSSRRGLRPPARALPALRS